VPFVLVDAPGVVVAGREVTRDALGTALAELCA
jgi:hypothetical protein